LLQHGVRALSDAELLALFIRSGIPGENARDLALRLLKTSDGLRGLARRSSADLLRVPGLGPAKVASLIASFEMGNRVLTQRMERRPFIDSAQTLFDLLRHSLCHEREEVFLGVLLNAKNEIMKTVTFSRGDPTRIVISIPQVMRQILMEGSAAVIFAHNHPSGDPAPSKKDIRLTRRLSEACQTVEITLHDHLIFGDRSFFSFAQQGRL
jgi:DNA repair protein RadC